MRLADFILANIEPILADWETFARSIWPESVKTEPAALRDDAEGILRAAAADMKSDQTPAQQPEKSKGRGDPSRPSDPVKMISSTHGASRHGSGFDLVAVLSEYRALRASVIRLWRESSPKPTLNDLADLTRFNESIDQSLTQAVIAYTKLQERELQAAIDAQTRLSDKLRGMNETLLVSNVRQHELTEQAQSDLTAVSERAESLVECQKETLELVVRGEPIERVLDLLARSMQSQLHGGAIVAIHLMESDGYHFGHVTAPSLPAEYARATAGMDARLELGCCSSAVMSHRPMIVHDFADPAPQKRWPAFTAMVAKLKLRGCFTTPILSLDKRVLGTFAIYYREPCDPNPHDQQLVDIVKRTLGIAIERKQAEQALGESEARFRMLADNMSQLAWTCDKLGNVTWYNRRWLDYTGLSFDEMKGWDWSKVQHPDHLARVVKRVQMSAENGEPWDDTFPLRGKDGKYRWFLSRAVPIRDESGGIIRWFGTNTDITEEREAKQHADDASRAKDRFLAVLSHELRTPLTPVLMTAAALEARADLSPELHEDVSMIRRNVELQSRLIDDLLDLSRIINGKLRLSFDTLDVNDLVRSACDTCRSNLRERGIQLYCDFNAEGFDVVGDEGRLQQVFWNLINNATKFTPEHGQIFVRTENIAEEEVRVTVRDTGIGIPPEALESIFNAFEQAGQDEQPGLARKFGGMGLGLAICRALIEQHRGSIRACSDGKDTGATFIVELPAVARRDEAKIGSGPTEPEKLRPLHLLVVEDHPDTATVLARLLTSAGHEVEIANTAADALTLAREHEFDVVVSDLGLPDMTGYELMRRIKQRWDIKGIAMSGYGMEEDIKKSEQAGFSDHLVKPVNLSQLEQAIRRVSEDGDAVIPVAKG